MQSQVAALLDGPAPNGPLIRVGHALFCLQHELLGLLDRVVEMLLHLLRVVQQQRRDDQIVLHQVEAAHRHRVVARDGRVELFENGHDLRLVLFDEIIGDHFGYFSAMRHIDDLVREQRSRLIARSAAVRGARCGLTIMSVPCG